MWWLLSYKNALSKDAKMKYKWEKVAREIFVTVKWKQKAWYVQLGIRMYTLGLRMYTWVLEYKPAY